MAAAKKTAAARNGVASTKTVKPAVTAKTPKAPKAGEALATEAPARVLRRFRVVFNAVKAHFRQVEKTTGVGGAQLWALGVVQARQEIGVNELSQAMDVHQSTASNLVKTLVERGLILTERKGADRRAVTLRISPQGSRLLRKAPGPFSGVLPEALASLDARTLSRLDADLGLLIAALHADERSAGIPLGQQD